MFKSKARRHFENAAAQFAQDWPNMEQELCDHDNLENLITPYFPYEWVSISFNCYNFAYDTYEPEWAQPGMRANPDRETSEIDIFLEYQWDVQKHVALDGLYMLGGRLPKLDSIYNPTETLNIGALFLRKYDKSRGIIGYGYNPDYHWYALRLSEDEQENPKLVWAHKAGECDSEVIDDNAEFMRTAKKQNSIITIFDEARARGYRHFVGFYKIPEFHKYPRP